MGAIVHMSKSRERDMLQINALDKDEHNFVINMC